MKISIFLLKISIRINIENFSILTPLLDTRRSLCRYWIYLATAIFHVLKTLNTRSEKLWFLQLWRYSSGDAICLYQTSEIFITSDIFPISYFIYIISKINTNSEWQYNTVHSTLTITYHARLVTLHRIRIMQNKQYTKFVRRVQCSQTFKCHFLKIIFST